jgi:hypothetical protein
MKPWPTTVPCSSPIIRRWDLHLSTQEGLEERQRAYKSRTACSEESKMRVLKP